MEGFMLAQKFQELLELHMPRGQLGTCAQLKLLFPIVGYLIPNKSPLLPLAYYYKKTLTLVPRHRKVVRSRSKSRRRWRERWESEDLSLA